MDELEYLRSLVDRYLARELSLESFEDEFVPLVPQIAQLRSDHEAARMASSIDLSLAEMSQGHRSEDEFRGMLEALMAVPATIHLVVLDEASDYHDAEARTEYRRFDVHGVLTVIVNPEPPTRGISAAETRLVPAPLKDREVSGSAADTQRATVPA